MLVAFVLHERRSDHPMLPLSLFRSRNFAVGNVATLLVYGGLGAATFFVAIFLQQVAGYSAVAAGVTLLPITVIMFVLSRRWGALSDRIGPRALMGAGPIVAGVGLVWMGRLGTDVDYVTDLLPAVLLFGLGLSMTVAPLTNTVLGAVPQHNAGVASGANNAISRVAGLLAIAAVGAVVAAQFGSALDDELARARAAADARPCARSRSGRCRAACPGAPALDAPVEAASVHAYRVGLGRRRRADDARRRDLADRDRQPGAARASRSAREAHGATELVYPCPERGGARPRPRSRASLRLACASRMLTPAQYQRVTEVALGGADADRLHRRRGAADRLRARLPGLAEVLRRRRAAARDARVDRVRQPADLGPRRARRGRRGRARVAAAAVPARPRARSACCCRSASSARRCSAASRSATTSRPAS